MESKLEELEKELEEAKSHLRIVMEERDDLQKENTKVTFEIADLKSQLENKSSSVLVSIMCALLK